MKISIEVPETWYTLKIDHDLTWRNILRRGIRAIEEEDKNVK